MAAAEPRQPESASLPSEPADPLDGDAFAALMAPLGPFERGGTESGPVIAVGVSGGADSLALCLLAAAWVRARGGRLTALIVDHGLRPASADEAAATAHRLAGLGVPAAILPWQGAKPAAGVQARARRARLRLMLAWCRERGVLHLLLAHHARDQRETVLMRLLRGSGIEGLAGMRAVVETGHLRLLRPLLTVEPERLRAWLRARDLTWIEDPSNADPAFARARLRQAWTRLAASGITDADLDRLQVRARAAADGLDDAVTALLVRACRLDPAGWASLDRSVLAAAPGEIAWRALARVLALVGGRAWLPGWTEAARLLARIGSTTAAGALGCLSGARVIAAGGRILVVRECRGLPAPMPIAPREAFGWDNRFVVSLRAWPDPPPASLSIQPVSAAASRQIAALNRAQAAAVGRCPIPGPHLPALPALFQGGEVVAVPHLGFTRSDWPADPLVAVYRPRRTLAGTGYFTGDCF